MSKRAPGFEDYTPSRLEWFVVLLNSFIPYINSPQSKGIECTYVPENDGKTVTVLIKHSDDLDPNAVKVLEHNAKTFAMNMAKNYKWDSWISVQTQYDPIEEQTSKT